MNESLAPERTWRDRAWMGMRPWLVVLLASGAACRLAAPPGDEDCDAIRSGEPQVDLVELTGAGAGCGESNLGPGDYIRTLRSGGRNRMYEVHVPRGYAGGPVPAVIVYHGGGDQPTLVRAQSGMDAVSDANGFIVLYPYGTGPVGDDTLLTWNAGGGAIGYAFEHNVNDVGFSEDMLDDVSRFFCIDPRRVYAAGLSNGAQMAYRIACSLSERIAAIGAVSGTMPSIDCVPPRAVPVIHFHGTDDRYAPYDGGVGPDGTTGFVHVSVEEDVSFWLGRDGCTPVVTESWRAGDAELTAYEQCEEGAAVVLVTLHGGGHAWPGGSLVCETALGPMNEDISASEMMWDFFAAHPLPEGR